MDAIAVRCGDGFTPPVIMLDICPKERAGFADSIWAKRGTVLAFCYFHLQRCWIDALRRDPYRSHGSEFAQLTKHERRQQAAHVSRAQNVVGVAQPLVK